MNIGIPISSLNQTQQAQGYNAAEQLVDASDNIVTKSDPGFADYANKDFTLKDDSEVYKKIPDFPKLDFKNMGLSDGKNVGVQ